MVIGKLYMSFYTIFLCEEVTFNVGDKIAQILFEKISLLALREATKIKFEFEDQTKRETVAFGSSDGKY